MVVNRVRDHHLDHNQELRQRREIVFVRFLRTVDVPSQIVSRKGPFQRYKSRRVPCAKSVPESDVFMPLGLALSEKQIPQITENTEKSK
jgi:hypothetical protein